MMSAAHPVTRRGSALLIVLGFLSFMVVSAVAFAVFMRAERAPSSALRRGVATRHLVKAALARAISAVDDAVRSDVFPGRSNVNKYGQLYVDRAQNPIDVWYGRVFMPPDPEGGTQLGNDETRFAPISETVSVLNLEGLGYLPPPLVNDVRFLSRCSWSAKWQNLPYDSGRCAYVAVNVSDYFDINRLRANTGRNSSDDARISLSASFLKEDGKEVDKTAASRFDELVASTSEGGRRITYSDPDDGVNASQDMPYLSMLDYNLALGERGDENGLGDGYNSPFWTWIKKGRSNRYFYRSLDRNEKFPKAASRQTFVTDSWFPVADGGSGGSTSNLFYETAQPFRNNFIDKGDDAVVMDVIDEKDEFKTLMQTKRKYFNLSDWVTLYDYLDRDDMPLSLVQPSVERIPMVVAMTPRFNGFNLKLIAEKEVGKDGVDPNSGDYTEVTTYRCVVKSDSLPTTLGLDSVVAFPFKHGRDLNSGKSYEAQAMLRVFLTASMNPETAIPLRGTGMLANLRPRLEEWTGTPRPLELKRGGAAAVFTYVDRANLSYPGDIGREEDAFMNRGVTTFNLRSDGIGGDTVLFQRIERQEMTAAGTKKGTKTGTWEFPIPLMQPDGTVLQPTTYTGDEDPYKNLVIRPCAAVWYRISEGGNDVVDYVPAVLADDKELNNIDNREMAAIASRTNHGPVEDRGTDDSPAALLPLVGTAQLKMENFVTKAIAGGAEWTPENGSMTEFTPKSFFTVDPRFNWAPEDWIPQNLEATKDNWLSSLDNILGQDGRAMDIFLSVSNQGYLQSMGELAMLPRQTDDDGTTIDILNRYDGQPRAVGSDWTSTAHAAVAWRSYPIDYEVEDKLDKLFANDELARNGWAMTAEGSGFRVNPYTDSVQVMRTVIANTPCDWWAAGTNGTAVSKGNGANTRSAQLKDKIMKDVSEAVKYAFCEDNPDQSARLAKEDVDRIAQLFVNTFAAAASSSGEADLSKRSWEYAFDRLPWRSEDPNEFLGIKLQNNVMLHDVDRKFLYSFWRGCFANKQQLFLIFVRAESNALGGSGEGTPAQQGGRAVALVWRDPELDANAIDNYDKVTGQQYFQGARHPHRTRVLFYHQFD